MNVELIGLGRFHKPHTQKVESTMIIRDSVNNKRYRYKLTPDQAQAMRLKYRLHRLEGLERNRAKHRTERTAWILGHLNAGNL